MASTMVFAGGDKLTFEIEPDELERLLAQGEQGESGLVRLERGNGPVFINREQVLFIRGLDYGEVATPSGR